MRCDLCGIDRSIFSAKFIKRQKKIYCSACIRFLGRKRPSRKEYKKEIEQILKTSDKSSAYGAIVLLSGGKDSVAALYVAVKYYELKVLAVTVDNGFLSNEAKKNIEKVTAFLKVDHKLILDKSWFDSIKNSIKNNDLPCLKICAGHKLNNIMKLHKRFPDIKCFITGDELPFVFDDNYSSVKKANGFFLLRVLCGWIKKEKDVYGIISDLPWEKHPFYGYTSDCLAVGYALEKYKKIHGLNPEEIYLSDRVRHGLINKRQFMSFLNKRNKNLPRHSALVKNILLQKKDIDYQR